MLKRNIFKGLILLLIVFLLALITLVSIYLFKQSRIEKDDDTAETIHSSVQFSNEESADRQSQQSIDDEINTDSISESSTEDPSIATSPLENEDSLHIEHSQIRIDIPQTIQENAYYCGPASLQMVLAYHDIHVSQDQLAKELNTSATTGTEYDDLARVASEYIFGKVENDDTESSYRSVTLSPWSSDSKPRIVFEKRAVSDLKNGDPVFVSINNEVAYGLGNGTVHQVVLYGVDLDGEKPANFYYLDPSYKQQDPTYAGKKKVSADDLWKFMIQNPEPGYVW